MPELVKYTKELTNLISESGNLLIISHINPDGDAIGSQLALYHFLQSKGIEAAMMVPNNLQEFLKWMDGSDKIEIYIKNRQKCRKMIETADLIIMVDFNQSHRLGEAEEAVKKSGARKVVIDHHLNPSDFADLVISDPAKSSTAEIMYELVSEINEGPFISVPFAEAIYVGIVTDTGNFVHGNYTPGTFRITADLIETGIDKSRILNLVYNTFSADRMKLLGFALNQRMVVLPEFKTAYIYLTKEDLDNHKHSKGDTEGFVNLPLSINGIHFTALFIEKVNFVKLSFRSKGSFPTNEFATRYFGGGGHLNASGGEYYDTLDNTIDHFLKALQENIWRFEEQ